MEGLEWPTPPTNLFGQNISNQPPQATFLLNPSLFINIYIGREDLLASVKLKTKQNNGLHQRSG